MKKLLLLLFCVFILGNIQAQIVNIPDANFKARLLESSPTKNIAYNSNYERVAVDVNNNGEIEISEALNIFELNFTIPYLNNTKIDDLTGIEAFINLEALFFSDHNVSSPDLSQNINLTRVNCERNNIIDLDFSENINLVYLSCGSDNSLTNLNITQNTNLEFLACSYSTNLSSIDLSNNINLIQLEISGANLMSLDLTQNLDLEFLRYNEMPFTDLDLLQNINLKSIYFVNSQLSNLNISQNIILETLDCTNCNNLSSIDLSNNINLEVARLSGSNLMSIDISQNPNLDILYLENNQITDINLSQVPNLRFFNCENNLLTQLDLSHNDELITWRCSNNQISYIDIKNSGDSGLNGDNIYSDFSNNPIEYICADEHEVLICQELANFQVPVGSYCSFTPGGDYNSISGNIALDFHNNGCDINDSSLSLIRLDISDGANSGFTASNDIGDYVFFANEGSYDITPYLENLSWFSVSPTTAQISFTDLNNTVNQNFCITANGVHNDVEILIVPIVAAQPGFDASYQIVYKNKGNQLLSGSVDFSYDDSILDLISTSIAPANETSGNISWDYTDLNPFESRTIEVVFNVNSPMEIPAVNIDDILDFTATINPVSGDEIPDDNTFNLEQIVVGSYDPNDITCLEGDIVSPDKIGEYLHYNIRFENTGTAAATFVVIKDVIDDTNFDISTLQIMYASYEMQTRVINNTIEFIFDNINLGPNEKGNVLFKIKTNNTLTVGDSVENKAEIFFDYNFPIETNVATTSFQVLSIDEFENANAISVFPNPSNNNVTLKSKSNLKSIKVYDAMSRLVFETMIDDLIYSLNVSEYSEGLYFLEIQTEFGKKIKQLIKN